MSDAAYVTVADDRIEYRASALGGCDMALLAARLGYESVPVKEDAKIMQVFAAGHRIEDEVLKRFPSVVQRQGKVQMAVTGRISVVGHIDGFDTVDGTIVEVKSQSQEEWDRFEKHHWDAGLFLKYKWQASVYMHAHKGPFHHHPLKLIRALRDENGEWTGKLSVSHVDKPFYTVDDIRRRILEVERIAATGVLAAICTPQFPCPYFYLHEEIDRELIDDDTVEALAREYAEAGAEENAAKEKKRTTRKALRVAVDGSKYRTHTGVKITFYEASDPPRIDYELLEGFLEKHDRLLDEFMKRGKSERLRITIPKEDDATPTDDET